MSYTLSQHIGHVDALNLTVSLCLCYTLCIALTRLWIRRGVFGVDDSVVLVATLVALGHTGSSYAALALGLGKPWSEVSSSGKLPQLNTASITGVITFIIALYISKIGVLAFLSRITKDRAQLRIYYAGYWLVAVFGVISLFVVTVGCSWPSGYYWAFFANSIACDSQLTRWQVLTALDIITELGLLLLPIHLVWKLQMPRIRKAVLLIAFYLRLPVIALSIGRNAYTLRLRRQNSDVSLDSAIVTIWLEVQLAYALAASTLSALKTFTESFNSGFGLGFTRGKSENGSYALSAMSRSPTGTGTSIASRNKSDRAGTTPPPAEKRRNKEDKFPSSVKTSNSSTFARPLQLRPDLIGPRASATATATSEGDSRWDLHHHYHGSTTSIVHPIGDAARNMERDNSREPVVRASEGLVIMRETQLSVSRDLAPGYTDCQK